MRFNFENWSFDTLQTILICLFLPIFLYFAYWLFFSGIIGLFRMIDSKKWKNTIGKITKTQIKYKTVGDDNELSFVLEKTYDYNVNGLKYESNQNLASDSLFSKDYKNIEKLPKSYGDFQKMKVYTDLILENETLIGKEIKVYYKPEKPARSCLQTGIQIMIYLPIFMGFIFGIGLTYFATQLLKTIVELK